jgi:hypothetical protein
MLYGAVGWWGTADAWSKLSREYLTSNSFLIDKNDVLRRVSFGIRRMPVVLAPGSDALPDELKEYNIKTAQLQGEAILVCFP